MAGPTLLDVFDSAAGAVNTTIGIVNKEMEKQADLDVLNWQAQFRVDSENFIRNLNYNSYESWNDDLTKFLDEQRSAAQRSAANPYTAKKIDSLITSYSSTMRNQVEVQAYNRRQEHNLLSMQDTANINRQTLSGQARIDANSLLYKTAFDNNVISETNYRSLMLAETQQAASDYYSDSISSAIDRAFSPAGQGGSWADIEAQIRADNTTFMNLAGDQIDKDGIRDNALKNGEKLYYARLGQIQDDNSNTLSEEFLKLVKLTSAADRYTAARSALALMDREMGGQLLSESSRLSYSKLFSGIVDGYLDDQAAARARSSGGSGSGTGAGNVTQDTFKNYIKTMPEAYFDQLLTGGFEGQTYYDIIAVGAETMRDAFLYDHSIMNPDIQVKWKDKTGPDQWGAEYEIQVKDAFYDLLKTNFKDTGAFNQVYNKYQSLEKMLKNEKADKWDADALYDLFDYTLDLIASTPAEKMGDIAGQLETYVNTCVYTQSRNKLFFDPKKSSDIRKNGAWSNKEIAEFAQAADENDIVFTDVYGQTRLAHGANTDAYASAMRYAVANWLGLENADGMDWHFEPTKNDKNTTAIVTYGGREYKVKANDNGKDYKVYEVSYDRNGKEILSEVEDRRFIANQRQQQAEQEYRNEVAISGAMAPQGDTPEELVKRRELIGMKTIPPAVDTFSKWQKTYDNLNALDWYSPNNRDIIVQDMMDALSEGNGKDIGSLYESVGLLDKKDMNNAAAVNSAKDIFNKLSEDERWDLVTSANPAETGAKYKEIYDGVAAVTEKFMNNPYVGNNATKNRTPVEEAYNNDTMPAVVKVFDPWTWDNSKDKEKDRRSIVNKAIGTMKEGGEGSENKYEAAGYEYHTYKNEKAISDEEYRKASAQRFNALDKETQEKIILGLITPDQADLALYLKAIKGIGNGDYDKNIPDNVSGEERWKLRAEQAVKAGYKGVEWHRLRDVYNGYGL